MSVKFVYQRRIQESLKQSLSGLDTVQRSLHASWSLLNIKNTIFIQLRHLTFTDNLSCSSLRKVEIIIYKYEIKAININAGLRVCNKLLLVSIL